MPAHTGIEGNELADNLAKEATTKVPSPELIKLPISYVKIEVIKERDKKWQQEWTNASQGRLTFEVINKVSTDFISENPVVNTFLTGHGPFLAYLKRFQKIDNEECVCGEGVAAVANITVAPLPPKHPIGIFVHPWNQTAKFG